jgi:hypothetical protein
MKRFQILLAAFIAILSMSLTIAPPSQAYKQIGKAIVYSPPTEGTFTSVTIGSSPITPPPGTPVTNPLPFTATNVTAVKSAINAVVSCLTGLNFVCAYKVVKVLLHFIVKEIFYKGD